MIRKNILSIEDDEIQLSKKEKFFDGDRQKIPLDVVDKMVICRESEFIGTKGTAYNKEIYCAKDAHVESNTKIRAIYSESNIIIDEGTELLRWADSEGTLAIYDNCNLGISVSSGERMSIGQNCEFRRMYAPEIYIGQYPIKLLNPKERKDKKVYCLSVQKRIKRNVRYISNEMANEEGVVDYTIVSSENVRVTENIIVQGDIRSHKSVRLFDGAIVVGNIFAEGNVILGINSCVIGNVFSQENVYLESGATIGQSGTISSLVARGNIILEPETFVFGYVSCEKGGKISRSQYIPSPEFHTFLQEKEKVKVLTFRDLDEYEDVLRQGFRHNEIIEEVIIPDGAKKIPKSMFFKCTSLQKIHIPNSIEEIGDFAFMDCEQLKEISLITGQNLKRIGISAFENCRFLETIEIPESVEIIDAAAFSGCANLRNVIFEENSALETVKDHAFQGCVSLIEIKFVNYVEIASDNTFKNCTSLKRIYIPDNQVVKIGA
ncbi:leucine-rich repeat protein [Alkalibaculum bacchi]|uniref:leucine-rich repeat protein n=1 Tax=Alkalibaculum bacchi TaxID=645887 RepID=UPI0026E96BD5|nr:leucine-rich repeat protein [Alkalibaculum bacchi]